MAKPWNQPPEVASGHSQTVEKALDSQTLAAFGAACIDHGAATTGLHANQKTVGTGATCLGGLVGAFHNCSFVPNAMNQHWDETQDYRKLSQARQINCIFDHQGESGVQADRCGL